MLSFSIIWSWSQLVSHYGWLVIKFILFVAVILHYKISWQTFTKEFKNILCTRPTAPFIHTQTSRISTWTSAMVLTINNKKTIIAAKHAGCQYKTSQISVSSDHRFQWLYWINQNLILTEIYSTFKYAHRRALQYNFFFFFFFGWLLESMNHSINWFVQNKALIHSG